MLIFFVKYLKYESMVKTNGGLESSVKLNSSWKTNKKFIVIFAPTKTHLGINLYANWNFKPIKIARRPAKVKHMIPRF